MVQQVVKPENLGIEFDIGNNTANKITVNIDGTLTKDATTGAIGLNGGAITVVSADTGNIIRAGAANGALLTQADVQAVESVWSASEPSGFLTSTAAGTNGHTVTYGFDWTNADFIEAVQDAVGQGVLAGAGIQYDDVANAISSSLGNLAFNAGLIYDDVAKTVAVKPDPASPSPVTATAAGVSVTTGISADAGNLAALGADNKVYVDPAGVNNIVSEELQDAFGNRIGDIIP